MQAQIVVDRFLQSNPPDLSSSERFILLAIGSLLGKHQSFKFSIQRLIDYTALGRMTIFRALKSLKQRGLISYSRQSTQANEYKLTIKQEIPQYHSDTMDVEDTYHSGTTQYHGDTTPYHHGTTISIPNISTNISTTTTTGVVLKKDDKSYDRFEEFWEEYPIKVARKKAKQIWGNRRMDKMADQIIADLILRKANDNQWRRGFAPHPTTYLNQDRWEDQLIRRSDNGRIDVRQTLAADSRKTIPEVRGYLSADLDF